MPLAMFLAFNAATLAVPGAPGDPLARLVAQGGPALSAAVATFSLLAIFTSFAGTATGTHRARPSCSVRTEVRVRAARTRICPRWSAALPAAVGMTGATHRQLSNGVHEGSCKYVCQGVVVMVCSRCLGPTSHVQPAFCPACQQAADLLPLIAGLSATLASEVQAVVGGGDGGAQGPGPLQRAGVLALALGPPLAISLAHPGSFLAVLQARRAACLGKFLFPAVLSPHPQHVVSCCGQLTLQRLTMRLPCPSNGCGQPAGDFVAVDEGLQAVGGYGMTCLWGLVPPLMACALPSAEPAAGDAAHEPAARGTLHPAALALAFAASVGGPLCIFPLCYQGQLDPDVQTEPELVCSCE